MGAASDTGYTFAQARFAPRLGIRANIASGDKDRRDPDTQTFSPLFPGTAYSGKIGLIGLSNVIDAGPTARFRLHPRVYFLPEDSFFWRESTDDGIYGVTGALTRIGSTSQARFIGNQVSLPVQFQIDRHLTYTVFYSRFIRRPVLEGVSARPLRDVHQHLHYLQILNAPAVAQTFDSGFHRI